MRVEEVCQKDPVSASPEESVREGAKRMKSQGVGALAIVDADRRPVGMVTDRDIALKVLRRGKDPDATALADIMNTEVVHVWGEAPLERAFHRMRQEASRRVVVVDTEGALIGIMTVDDSIALIASELSTIAGVLAAQSPARAATATNAKGEQ